MVPNMCCIESDAVSGNFVKRFNCTTKEYVLNQHDHSSHTVCTRVHDVGHCKTSIHTAPGINMFVKYLLGTNTVQCKAWGNETNFSQIDKLEILENIVNIWIILQHIP